MKHIFNRNKDDLFNKTWNKQCPVCNISRILFYKKCCSKCDINKDMLNHTISVLQELEPLYLKLSYPLSMKGKDGAAKINFSKIQELKKQLKLL